MKLARVCASRVLLVAAVCVGLLAAFLGMLGTAVAPDDAEPRDK